MFNFGHDFGVGQQFVLLIYEYTQSLSFSNTLKWKRRRFSVPNEWMNVFIYFHDRTSYFDCSSFMYCCCCLIRIIFVELGYAIHVKFTSWYSYFTSYKCIRSRIASQFRLQQIMSKYLIWPQPSIKWALEVRFNTDRWRLNFQNRWMLFILRLLTVHQKIRNILGFGIGFRVSGFDHTFYNLSILFFAPLFFIIFYHHCRLFVR